jgi:hypothetical protein
MRQGFQTGSVPQGWINPYGQGLAGLATQQLGRPMDIGALTPGVAGPGAFTQAQQQLTSNRIYKVFKIKSYLIQQATKPTCHRINKM